MTSGDNGANTPEDDDPFGYLYADGQARGAQPPSGGYGYPNAVSRVRTVGERQYGQQPPAPQQQGAYGRPNSAPYQAPENPGGGAPSGRRAMAPAGGGRRGPNTKGLLIGAIAVVAAVVIGISFAMMGDDSDGDKSGDQAGADPSQSQSAAPRASSSSAAPAGELPKTDAKDLKLDGGAIQTSEFKGSKAVGGTYVSGFNQVGAKATWTVNGIEKAGTYRLYVRYGVPGADANATLLVNGEANTQPLNMKNFGGTPAGDWEKGWKTTWANVNLTKGTNTIVVACNDGNQCNAVLDQFYITK
ncbi:carbohydrate-binding protein [Streptomyces sp. NPDC090108]|uniref:carbohydrate-binding protein n=1 Tax=Streptomyces sp. NPDC090108 TaxID=3365947 RepID=UPI0038231816